MSLSLLTSAATGCWSDTVVATIPEALRFSAERHNKATSDELAIGLGPTDGGVVATEVFLRCGRFRLHAVREVLIHMVAEDGFTQSTRAAMNQHHELLLAQAEFFESVRVENSFHRL